MVKQHNKNTSYYFPHGAKILFKEEVIAAWLGLLAVVIIPSGITFELNLFSAMFILVATSVIFAVLLASLKPKVFLTFQYGIISWNTNQLLWKKEFSIAVSEIEKVKTTSVSMNALYFIPISNEEKGLILVDKLGDEYSISISNFNRFEDYLDFKNTLLNSPDLNLI